MLTCRACGKADVPVTVIWGAGPDGAFVPKSAVCGDCTAPAPQASGLRAGVVTAWRPGTCPACGGYIRAGDKIAKNESEDFVHIECSQ